MDIRDALAARAVGVQVVPGTSSYWTKPTEELDPSLFTGTRMKPEVRRLLMGMLYRYWDSKGFAHAVRWSTAYLCGSGASYQWSAARSPGDLDVLIGVDHVRFRQANPAWQGIPDADIDRRLTDELRAELWPQTGLTTIGGSTYEVTFYVNQGGRDIRAINPYAAYNLNNDEWTVTPDRHQQGQDTPERIEAANWDTQRSNALMERHRLALEGIQHAQSAAQKVNAATELTRVAHEGIALFDSIHLGRHDAFGPTGLGFHDWANYRWQSAKRSGLVQQLGQLKQQWNAAQEDVSRTVYGTERLDDAHEALLRASLGLH